MTSISHLHEVVLSKQLFSSSIMAPAPLPDVAGMDQPGPHPSFIQVAKPYVFEHKVQECMTAIGVSEAKEDNIRLQGIAWIDSVRKAMQL